MLFRSPITNNNREEEDTKTNCIADCSERAVEPRNSDKNTNASRENKIPINSQSLTAVIKIYLIIAFIIKNLHYH